VAGLEEIYNRISLRARRRERVFLSNPPTPSKEHHAIFEVFGPALGKELDGIARKGYSVDPSGGWDADAFAGKVRNETEDRIEAALTERRRPVLPQIPTDPRRHSALCKANFADEPIIGTAAILQALGKNIDDRTYIRRHRADDKNPLPVWEEGGKLCALPCMLAVYEALEGVR
jgi:hypothetical protein